MLDDLTIFDVVALTGVGIIGGGLLFYWVGAVWNAIEDRRRRR